MRKSVAAIVFMVSMLFGVGVYAYTLQCNWDCSTLSFIHPLDPIYNAVTDTYYLSMHIQCNGGDVLDDPCEAITITTALYKFIMRALISK